MHARMHCGKSHSTTYMHCHRFSVADAEKVQDLQGAAVGQKRVFSERMAIA